MQKTYRAQTPRQDSATPMTTGSYAVTTRSSAWMESRQIRSVLLRHLRPFIKDVGERQPDLIQEQDSCQKYPLDKETFF